MDFGIAGVAAITVIAYIIGMMVKASPLDDKWIPIICGVAGGLLGVACLYLQIPDFPATDIINALAVGIVSGLAATGINQISKQLAGGIDYKTGYFNAVEEKAVLLKQMEEQELKEMAHMEEQEKDMLEEDLIPNAMPCDTEEVE